MFRIYKLLCLITTILILSCNPNQKPDQKISSEKEIVMTPPAENEAPEIPGVPKEVMVRLLNECTFVDYIFHKLPFSLSQSEDPSIDQNISFIDFNRPLVRIPKECKPIGRKFFQIKGEIVYDVDVYLTNQCKFYVFVGKNNKPLYANYMTEAAVKFYSQIAQQARGAIPQ